MMLRAGSQSHIFTWVSACNLLHPTTASLQWKLVEKHGILWGSLTTKVDEGKHIYVHGWCRPRDPGLGLSGWTSTRQSRRLLTKRFLKVSFFVVLPKNRFLNFPAQKLSKVSVDMQNLAKCQGRGCGGVKFFSWFLGVSCNFKKKKNFGKIFAKIFLSPINFACRQTLLRAFEVFFLSKTAGKFKKRFCSLIKKVDF